LQIPTKAIFKVRRLVAAESPLVGWRATMSLSGDTLSGPKVAVSPWVMPPKEKDRRKTVDLGGITSHHDDYAEALACNGSVWPTFTPDPPANFNKMYQSPQVTPVSIQCLLALHMACRYIRAPWFGV